MFDRNLLLDIIFIMIFVYYGYKYRYLTPTYESKKGLSTKHIKMNKENWKIGHEFAGALCFVYAAVLALLFTVKQIYIGYGTWLDKVQLVVEIVMVVSMPIFAELKAKRDGKDYIDDSVKDDPSVVGYSIPVKKKNSKKSSGKKKKK